VADGDVLIFLPGIPPASAGLSTWLYHTEGKILYDDLDTSSGEDVVMPPLE
jgi:hypothetical protein